MRRRETEQGITLYIVGMVFRNVTHNEDLEDKNVMEKLTYYSVRNGKMMEVPRVSTV